MAGIVSRPVPLKGLGKQRGYASQTLALLNEEPLLFVEEPRSTIFIHWLCVTVAVSLFFSFLSPFSWCVFAATHVHTYCKPGEDSKVLFEGRLSPGRTQTRSPSAPAAV